MSGRRRHIVDVYFTLDKDNRIHLQYDDDVLYDDDVHSLVVFI
jgi:hypothetical protein